MTELDINKKTTALVVIDLQKGIAARPTQPHAAKDVIHNAARLTAAFRKNAIPVFLVHVTSTAGDHAQGKKRYHILPNRTRAPDWSEFIPEIGHASTDIVIAKKQWGAFYGTDLELHSAEGAWTRLSCAV